MFNWLPCFVNNVFCVTIATAWTLTSARIVRADPTFTILSMSSSS